MKRDKKTSGWRIACVLALSGLLTACGFHLRGQQTLPYETLYLEVPPNTPIGGNLRRAILGGTTTQLTDLREQAQAVFLITLDIREKIVLSVNSSGRVREFQLRYRFDFRVVDQKGRNLMDPAPIQIQRDITFSDAAVLAKEAEEQLLWRDMEQDLVQQILRRLAAAKIKPIVDAN